MWDVRKEHVAAELVVFLRHPNGAFGPIKAAAEHFDLGVFCDQFIQRRVKPIHSSDVCEVGGILCGNRAVQANEE